MTGPDPRDNLECKRCLLQDLFRSLLGLVGPGASAFLLATRLAARRLAAGALLRASSGLLSYLLGLIHVTKPRSFSVGGLDIYIAALGIVVRNLFYWKRPDPDVELGPAPNNYKRTASYWTPGSPIISMPR